MEKLEPKQRRSVPVYRSIIDLYLLQIIFIALTPLMLESPRLATAWPLLFLAFMTALGFLESAGMRRPLLHAFLAGVASQAPGIVSASVILTGVLCNIDTPEAFDFITQVWYSHFAPLFGMLPRLRYDGVPLYFMLCLALPFILPFLPALGALLQLRRLHSGRRTAAMASRPER